MTTVFNSLVKAFETKLKEAPAVCANIYVSRDRQVPEGVLEAVHIEFSSAVPVLGPMATEAIDWTTRITVDCLAKSTSQSGPDAVDQLFSKVYQRLVETPSLGLQDVFIGIPTVESDFESHGLKAGQIRMTFEVQHRTRNSSLE